MTSSPRPELCVSAVVVDSDRLLLVKRGRGTAAGWWSVPGGRVEGGETVAEAVVRELAEETGLVGECGEFVGWAEVIDGAAHAVILDFRVNLLHVAEPVADDDADDARWVKLSDVAGYPLAPGLADFLARNGIIPVTGPG